jgi:hypothetical protein
VRGPVGKTPMNDVAALLDDKDSQLDSRGYWPTVRTAWGLLVSSFVRWKRLLFKGSAGRLPSGPM